MYEREPVNSWEFTPIKDQLSTAWGAPVSDEEFAEAMCFETNEETEGQT